ncbi:type I toxin-antitoxin system Ibs family toxin, partial [Salmonella enterica subsp. enterica serovar Bovismorbificans]|nr:type I toxin-antitoxin system Ibs family toxin [Salmonella enterica subsp. enterica serovar Bovismorbificans]
QQVIILIVLLLISFAAY